MNPDPVGPWGVIAAVILVILAVAAITCAAAVVVGRGLRRSRIRLELSLGDRGQVHDNTDRLWIEGPDGLYDLNGSADPADQSWTYDQLDRAHGPLTPRTGQDLIS